MARRRAALDAKRQLADSIKSQISSRMDDFLAMFWKGDKSTVKALLDHYTHWVYADRKVLRKQVYWGEALPDLKKTLFRV